MADQVFDLTQTGQQVQDIINDASKVKDAGAQTTLTTESVLLKDVNGNYHKILKSSFTEAIRDTLAGLLVNNDKGTTISRIAAIASNDFGSITTTNLASVLGEAGMVFERNYGSGYISMKFGVTLTNTSVIILLITRCFYNIPASCGIIMIGRNTAAYDMSELSHIGGLNFSFTSEGSKGVVTVTNGNYGNGLGVVRITVLQRSNGASFDGEINE